ncbi:saccharopine dehydrogenase family protein [Thalassiella azotivora]
MSARRGERELDLVVLGATGFTGRLAGEHLARHAPAGLRWAVAGRDPGRLAAVRDHLTAVAADDGCAPVADVVLVDVERPATARAAAERTRTLVTTVGPYLLHGEPVVAACAASGTDYLDLTGEPEFVDRTWLAHHDTARDTGARLVHACGFDSVPHDLGVQHLVTALRERGWDGTGALTVQGQVRASGALSGGTFASALTAASRPRAAREAARARRDREPRPSGRRVAGAGGLPHRDHRTGRWLVPLPTVDPQVVLRSARALPAYGEDFRYGHWASLPNPLLAGGLVAGAAGLVAAAQVPPLRSALARVRPPGSGPDDERRARGWFRVRFDAVVDGLTDGDDGPRHLATQVSGGDPGYGATAVMLAESALCLTGDDLPRTAGQVTTAVAMGAALRHRLQTRGIRFEVLDG